MDPLLTGSLLGRRLRKECIPRCCINRRTKKVEEFAARHVSQQSLEFKCVSGCSEETPTKNLHDEHCVRESAGSVKQMRHAQGISSRIVDWIGGNDEGWRGAGGSMSPEPTWLAPWISPMVSCGPSVVMAPLHACPEVGSLKL